jgi:hypothetical protein
MTIDITIAAWMTRPLTGGAYMAGRAADAFPVLHPLIRYRNTGT